MSYLHYFARAENAQVCFLLLKHGANLYSFYEDNDDNLYSCYEDNDDGENETPLEIWPELENIIKRVNKQGFGDILLHNTTYTDLLFK
jgi:L-rhamnose mutarotase